MAALPPLTWRSYSITFAPADFAAFSIAIDEPASSDTRMTTFAPLPRHWSACERCFCASPLALLITYETFAFVKAATSAGRSCVSQRTDVLGSGSSTQMSALALFLLTAAVAPATVAIAAAATSSSTVDRRKTFFTRFSFWSIRGVSRKTLQLRHVRQGQLVRLR